jgi:hypothetical protein
MKVVGDSGSGESGGGGEGGAEVGGEGKGESESWVWDRGRGEGGGEGVVAEAGAEEPSILDGDEDAKLMTSASWSISAQEY